MKPALMVLCVLVFLVAGALAGIARDNAVRRDHTLPLVKISSLAIRFWDARGNAAPLKLFSQSEEEGFHE